MKRSDLSPRKECVGFEFRETVVFQGLRSKGLRVPRKLDLHTRSLISLLYLYLVQFLHFFTALNSHVAILPKPMSGELKKLYKYDVLVLVSSFKESKGFA